MKIALVTIHNSTNYGAVLQAYATQKVLSRYGQVTLLDYDNEFLSGQMRLVRTELSVHGFLKTVHDVLRLPFRLKHLSKFRGFFSSYLNLSEKVSRFELLSDKVPPFDVYVCGSDQIWNPAIVNAASELDEIYFLGFVSQARRKISYASSMGSYNFTLEQQQRLAELIEGFDSISLRESDGVGYVSELLGRSDICHVLDPTLLLNSNEWLSALDLENTREDEGYILVYTVPRTPLIKFAVQYYKEVLGYKVIGIDPMLRPLGAYDIHLRDAGPREFVELFSRASFVITDSFHGVCFAINFLRPFVLVSPGVLSNRMTSLLNILCVEGRMVSTVSDLDNVSTVDDDLKAASSKLELCRAESLRYLDDAIRSLPLRKTDGLED